jgi:hypothetical protein
MHTRLNSRREMRRPRKHDAAAIPRFFAAFLATAIRFILRSLGPRRFPISNIVVSAMTMRIQKSPSGPTTVLQILLSRNAIRGTRALP